MDIHFMGITGKATVHLEAKKIDQFIVIIDVRSAILSQLRSSYQKKKNG
jgi:hypothetical protein